MRRAVEADRERRDAVGRLDRALVDRALDAQPAAGLAAVRADLVDVAVVVDGRAQELGDDDAAGDEHQGEHDERHPALRRDARRGRRLVVAGGEVERAHRERVGSRAQVQGLASSGSATCVAAGRAAARTGRSAPTPPNVTT